jgi:hypothetical protein
MDMTLDTSQSRGKAAGRDSYGAPWLVPAMCGCPRCGTARVITSPDPIGSCERCGLPEVVLPSS